MWVLFVFQHGCAKAILSLTFATYFGQIFWSGCPSPDTFKVQLRRCLNPMHYVDWSSC